MCSATMANGLFLSALVYKKMAQLFRHVMQEQQFENLAIIGALDVKEKKRERLLSHPSSIWWNTNKAG